jgi:hypothetical protein
MKKETKGVLLELGKPTPIETEHYTQVAKATAQALADEIATEITKRYTLMQDHRPTELIHQAALSTLTDWFLGKFKPSPTDPPHGAPEREENKGGASSP